MRLCSLLFALLWPFFLACDPKCNASCTTGTCLTSWQTAHGGYVLQSKDVAYHCNGKYFKPDCDSYWNCNQCVSGCAVNGNCAYYWLFADYDRATYICPQRNVYRDNCDSYWNIPNCRYGANRLGQCLYVEQSQVNDRASHCGADLTDRSWKANCDSYWSVEATCVNAADAKGQCYGWFAFSGHQPARQCSPGAHQTDCEAYWSLNLNWCRAVADRNGQCYSRFRRPSWGASSCIWGAYNTICDTYWSVYSNCRSVSDLSGKCYLGNMVPTSFYNFHCDSSVRDNCDPYWGCSCASGPCVKGSDKCWTPPTTCPVTCMNECDELGMCLDWSKYWDPSPASHCVQGFWGFACQNICPSSCALPGCTAGGLCLTYEKYVSDLPRHCKIGWGDACVNPCPAGCRNGCDNDGACVGWDRVILEGHLVLANATCYGGNWSSSCDQSCPASCVEGCMADGKCVGWWRYSGPADVALHCASGKWGHSCQWTCSCPGQCTTRGHCAPYHRLFARNQIASQCVISQRKYGPDCDLACTSTCNACRMDGECIESTVVPLCGRCLTDIITGCPDGVCPGYNVTVDKSRPSWCMPGFWDPACTSICPENCLQGCDNQGICIGWQEPPLNSTLLVTHCTSGFYGKECALPCPRYCTCPSGSGTCNTTCTQSGTCVNWQQYDDQLPASHCFDGCLGPFICDYRGYYGARCEYACPANCARDARSFSFCTGTGKCLGWNNYTDLRSNNVTHCLPGWYGPRCETMCPQRCAAGCSPQGFCLGSELATATLPSTHCQAGYWGNVCEFRCPASCCLGCTGTGKCVNWEGRLTSLYEPAKHCLSGFYGDDCRFKLAQTTCAQSGSTYGGFCIGVSEADPTIAVCDPGRSGIKCDVSCAGGCPLCGYCGNRRIGNFTPRCNAWAPGPPSEPTNVSIVTGDRLIWVYWDPPADNGNLTVWGFQAEVNGPSPTSNFCGQSAAAPCAGPPIVLGMTSTLPNFVNLTVRLRAQNEAGIGRDSITYSVFCFPPGPRPLNFTPSNSSSTYPQSIQLSLSGNLSWASNPIVFQLVNLNDSSSIYGGAENVSLIPDANQTRLVFTQGALKERDTYRVEFFGASLRDQDGHNGFDMNAQQFPWQFRVADVTPPDFITLSPVRDSNVVLVGLDALEATFAEDISLTSLAQVVVSHLDPSNNQSVIRQTRYASNMTLVGRTLQIPLSLAAVHARSAKFCVSMSAASVRDDPPESNPFVALNVLGPRAWCFSTSASLPTYMQKSKNSAVLLLPLSDLPFNLESESALAQFKVDLVAQLGLASGMSTDDALVRMSVVAVVDNAVSGITDAHVVVDCLPARAGEPDALTVITGLMDLADDTTSMWYSDPRVPLLRSRDQNVSIQAVFSASQSIVIDEVITSADGVTLRLSIDAQSGALHVYAVVVNPLETATPTSPLEVFSLLTNPSVICSIAASPAELMYAITAKTGVSFNLQLKCLRELLSQKRYEVVVAASTRAFEDTTTAVPASLVRSEFIVSLPFTAGTVVGILIWVLVAVLWALNKRFYSDSDASQVTALTEVLDLATDSLYVTFLLSFGLTTLAICQVLSIVIPIALNSCVAMYILRQEVHNSSSFRSKVQDNRPIIAVFTLIACANISSLGLMNSQLFHLKIFDFSLSEEALDFARRAGYFTNLLENIPQVIIVALAGTSLGIFDGQSQFTLAMSCLSIAITLIQLCLHLIASDKGMGI